MFGFLECKKNLFFASGSLKIVLSLDFLAVFKSFIQNFDSDQKYMYCLNFWDFRKKNSVFRPA